MTYLNKWNGKWRECIIQWNVFVCFIKIIDSQKLWAVKSNINWNGCFSVVLLYRMFSYGYYIYIKLVSTDRTTQTSAVLVHRTPNG